MKRLLLWACLLLLLFPTSVWGEADGYKSISTYPTTRPTRTSTCTGDIGQTCYDVNTGERLTEDWMDTRGDLDIKLCDKLGIGGTYPNADEVIIGTADYTTVWTAIADCNNAGQYLTYDTGTHTFICGDTGNYIGDITSIYSCTEGACTSITPADGSLLDMSNINCSSTSEGLYVPTSTDCSAATGTSQMCWDSNDSVLYIAGNAVGAFGGSIDDTEMTAEDFGDWSCTGAEDGCTIDPDSIALGTDTTGNYVAGATTNRGLVLTGTEGATLGLPATCTVTTADILKWDGDSWECALDNTGGSPTFGTIATGTNTAATMTCGSGCSILMSGTGAIKANALDLVSSGNLPIGSGDVTSVTITTADAGDGSDVTLPDGSIQSVEILDGTVAKVDMALADHGDVTWASGDAVVENVQCSTCIDLTSEVSGELPDANVAADLTISCSSGSVATNCLDADLQTLAGPSANRIFYVDNSQVVQQLALGSANTYLKSTGTGTAPEWASGTGAAGTDDIAVDELDDGDRTPTIGYAIVVHTDNSSFDYLNLATNYQGLDATLTALAGLTLTEDIVCSGSGLWDDADIDDNITVTSADSVEGLGVDEALLVVGNDGKFCSYDHTNSELDCDEDPAAIGEDAVGTTELNDAIAPTAGYAVMVNTGGTNFTYSNLASVYQPLESTLTDIADGTINENLVNTVNPWDDTEVEDSLTINGGTVYDNSLQSTNTLDTEWNTEAKVEAIWGDNILVDGEIATAALIRGLMTATEYTGTGDLVFAESPTLVTPTLGAASATSLNVGDGTGVSYVGSNGTVTIAGTGDGWDESIKFDFNTTQDTIDVSSPSLATEIDFGSLDLTTSGTISGNWSGNADTATQLAANGANCSAGNFPLGVDTYGAVETCTDVATQAELNAWVGSSNITTLGAIAICASLTSQGAITSSAGVSGTTITGTGKLSTTVTTEQLRLNYDAANYLAVTVNDEGATTIVTVDEDAANADLTLSPDGTISMTVATDVDAAFTASSVASDGAVSGTTGTFTGYITGLVTPIEDADGNAAMAASDCAGQIYYNNTQANTYILPAAAPGLNLCFYEDSAHEITIRPLAAGDDHIWYNGTDCGEDDDLVGPGTVGSFICLHAKDTQDWMSWGSANTWTCE